MYSRQELLSVVRQEMRGKADPLEKDEIIGALSEFYEGFGIYESEIVVRTSGGRTSRNIPFQNHYININEGRKLRVNQVAYNGLVGLSRDKIDAVF